MAEKKKAAPSAAPSPAGDKKKALETAIAQIEKNYGKGAIMRLGDDIPVNVEAISTGSLSLDLALGIGGVPRGRIVEIYGPESCGKTTLALHVVASAQKGGGEAAYIDVEHALEPAYARALGVDIDNLLISQPDTGEQVGPDPAGADDAPRLRDGGAVVAYYDRLLAPERALQGRRHLVVAARADDGVHLRQLGDDLVPVELREAAGDDELFEPSRLFEPGRFEDGVYGLLLCVLYEGAGVYDDGLGLGLVVRELIARVRELFEHLLRGDPVLRAAEGDHAYLHSSNSNP